MIFSKENISSYRRILANTNSKYEIYKYIFKRLFGVDAKFSKNVIINDGDVKINCGRIMENCKVASDSFEEIIKDVIYVFGGSGFGNLAPSQQGKLGTFIDVGAHIGKHALYAGKQGFDVIAIEGNPHNYALLRDNMYSNHVKATLFKEFVSDKKETVAFEYSELHPATGSIIWNNQGNKQIKIMSCTLDELLEGMEIKTPVLMKIDVEGAELKALQGGLKFIAKYKPSIIFEAWDTKRKIDITRYLADFGYYYVKRLDDYNYYTEVKA